VIADGLKLVPTTASTTTSEVFYVHNDHLGTPQVMTDQSQQIVWQATYDPFGKATLLVNTVENNVRFPGQYYDQETNLHYNYYRYYDPSTGRYITSDPIGLDGGINTYGYVGGNPVRRTDVYGLCGSCYVALSTALVGYYLFLLEAGDYIDRENDKADKVIAKCNGETDINIDSFNRDKYDALVDVFEQGRDTLDNFSSATKVKQLNNLRAQ